ncbi:MAG: diguanylate cyclase [Magnetococcales bacterium]|nr:diguanylate cyclase [Magnetococcales bacterium]
MSFSVPLSDDHETLRALTVLYAEDDPDIRQQLSLFLQRRVGRLLTAPNGHEGLKLFRDRRPDLVITDILMPGMDGLEMGRAMRETEPDLPIIVTTAHNDEAFFLRSIELGVDRYVLKPTRMPVLEEALLHCARSLWRRREVERYNRFLGQLMDLNPNLMAVVSEHQVEYLNRAFLDFLGFTSLEAFRDTRPGSSDLLITLDGVAYSLLRDGHGIIHLLHQKETLPVVYLAIPGPPAALRSRPGEDRARPFSVTFTALPGSGRHLFAFSDITRIEHERQDLRERVFTDPLTGACNRVRLHGLLNAETHRSRRHGHPLGVIMVDIDHFKRINDRYGYEAGDEILRIFSRVLSHNLRATEIVARWGGEEFLVVVPDGDLEGCRLLAEKLRGLVRDARFPQGERLTASFGVARFGEQDTLGTLAERAERAMLQAKESGRDRVVCL